MKHTMLSVPKALAAVMLAASLLSFPLVSGHQPRLRPRRRSQITQLPARLPRLSSTAQQEAVQGRARHRRQRSRHALWKRALYKYKADAAKTALHTRA